MRYKNLEKFMPPKTEKGNLDIDALSRVFGKKINYAADGKSALFLILKELNITGTILIPEYVCDSILHPIKKCGLKYICYDFEKEDLNASVASISKIIQEEAVSACLVASMYGNPADLIAIEKICRSNGVIMIDDAAQSVGAYIEGQPVGTFGNAGFFSFACGKPLVAHMGAFYWAENDSVDYSKNKTYHRIFHRVAYIDYYLNRVCRYKTGECFKFLSYLRTALWKVTDISNDVLLPFEASVLGGAIKALFEGNYKFRHYWWDKFYQAFGDNQQEIFKMICKQRGEAHPHKLVFVLQSKEVTEELILEMKKKNIYCGLGYSLINSDNGNVNAVALQGRIVEFPIENNDERMEYVLQQLQLFKGEMEAHNC